MHGGGISDKLFSTFTKRREVLSIVRKYFPEDLSFTLHVLPVWKGCLLQAVCKLFGKKYAPKILDALRAVRGLPPVWVQREWSRQ